MLEVFRSGSIRIPKPCVFAAKRRNILRYPEIEDGDNASSFENAAERAPPPKGRFRACLQFHPRDEYPGR